MSIWNSPYFLRQTYHKFRTDQFNDPRYRKKQPKKHKKKKSNAVQPKQSFAPEDISANTIEDITANAISEPYDYFYGAYSVHRS